MKHLRLLLLVLVACVAQMSHAQDLLETWYEEGLIREKMIPIMLFSNGKYLADYQKQFEDIAESLRGVHKYGSREVLNVAQKEEYILRHIDSVKDNLSKWQKKLEKGKSLDFEDALWGALVSQHDDAMAAMYFDAAAKAAKDDSTRTILQLASIGCKYSENNDKAAAAAAINFQIPDNCKKTATLIVNKYRMKDIPSEAIQQLSKVDNRLITRAIRSNNIEELKKYESYDIPEVDSVLARKEGTKDLYWKCIMKHKMAWPLYRLDYKDVMSRTDLPANIFKYTFFIPLEEGKEWKYKTLDYIVEKLLPSYDPEGNSTNNIFEYLNNLRKRCDTAAFTMAAIVQAFAQDSYNRDKDTYNRDFIFDLNEYTAQLLDDNESARAKSIENINNAFSDYFSISANGAVKLKFQAPGKRRFRDDDFRSDASKMIELYEKFASWIWNSAIVDYKPAEMPSNMDELKNILAQNVQEAVFECGMSFFALLKVDVDGSVISVDAIDDSGKSVWKEGVSHNVKMQTKCKPAMRGEQPYKDLLKIKCR